MNYLNYERLKEITERNTPYRGTKDRYPLSWREHSHKCFFVKKDEQGNDEYHIAYGYKWDRKDITKEEYDVFVKAEAEYQKARKEGKPYKRTHSYAYQDTVNKVTPTYWKSERSWDVLGVVRSDNTFEFTVEKYMGQGVRYFLTQMFDGGRYWKDFTSKIGKGGVVYEEYHSGETVKTIPIFQGQRIDLATNSSVINYTVHAPKVNRKRANEVYGGRKLEFKFMDAFFKTLPSDVFMSELKETYTEVFGEDSNRWRGEEETKMMYDYAVKHKDSDLVKSMYAIMMGRGIGNSWYLGRNGQQWGGAPNPYSYFLTARKHMTNQLVREGDALDYKEYGPNQPYPRNSWGVKVIVDGKEVRIY